MEIQLITKPSQIRTYLKNSTSKILVISKYNKQVKEFGYYGIY